MAVSKRTRYEVLKRDNHTCRYCGATAPDAKITVDHVVPVALGGGDAPSNLVAACWDCNAGKASTSVADPPVEDIDLAAAMWAKALSEAGDRLADERRAEVEYVNAFEEQWRSLCRWSLPVDYGESIARLHRSGLPIGEVLDAVAIGAGATGVYSHFAYVMGICWKRVHAQQEIARQILAKGDS